MINICRNCNSTFEGDICPNCGYNMNLNEVFDNVITNKQYKESIANEALAMLLNKKLITNNNLKNLIVEFGYLLLPKNKNNVSTLFKVIIPKKLFQNKKIFYFGTQENKLLLLNQDFNEALFKKISYDMLTMHKVDLNSINSKDYMMQLY